MKKNLLLALYLILITTNSPAGNPVKVMPVGDSITAGEHYGFPAMGERTGYRKALFWMLKDAEYDIDFVGSQKHGERSENDKNWYDWNCEAYPGWKTPDITRMVIESLPIYNPDFLLVHVGTNGNDWAAKPAQVMDMLDMINNFSVENNHPMTVFFCKIINRYYKEDPVPTTQFNNAVADSIAARTGDTIKIIIVDMENGAGLDYSDAPPDSTANPPYEGGDMWGVTYSGVPFDKYHPNDKGNTKMAVKFFKELVKELGNPSRFENQGFNYQPQQFKLYQNYPNPFNPSTSIEYYLSEHTQLSRYLILIGVWLRRS